MVVKLAFVVNRVETEKSNYSTVRIAWNAVNGGHEVSLIALADFVYESCGSLAAWATLPRHRRYSGDQEFLDDVQSLLAGSCREDRVAVSGKDPFDHTSHAVLVLDNQDRLAARGSRRLHLDHVVQS